MDKVTYVGNADVNAIEYLYQSYIKDPESVDLSWQKFFEGFDFARMNYEDGGIEPGDIYLPKPILFANAGNTSLPWQSKILVWTHPI